MIELRRSENLLPVDELFGAPKRNEPAARFEEPQSPDVRNTDAVLELLQFRALAFRNRKYRVPPVPWTVGLQLQRLQYRIIDIRKAPKVTEALLDTYDAAVTSIRTLARRLLIPLGWRRWLWRAHIRPDPLKDATEGELGVVLDFLLRCRTTAPVRLRIAADQHPEST